MPLALARQSYNVVTPRETMVMANRLSHELSPYLLQHVDNPVDWRPWDAEAFRFAREEHKPIFLSIGYSSCHWCHVMAHESFEDPGIARLLNRHFVSIKVDREERLDLDQIYMEAVQMMTGRGGWPMSVFLTPEGKPFFGGTYWPPQARGGMPGFDQVLGAIAEAWQHRRNELLAQAERMTHSLREVVEQGFDADAAELDDVPREEAEAALRQAFDSQYGGFGPAPKFPQPLALRWLLGRWRRSGAGRVAGDGHHHLGPHGGRRAVRPSRRRFPPLQRRRSLAGAALRENALRQCLAGSLLSRGMAGHGPTALCRGGATNARLSAPRHDRPAGRHLQQRGCRQRGRRGQILSLDARRDPGRARSAGRQNLLPGVRRERDGQFRGPKHSQPVATLRDGGKNARPRAGPVDRRIGCRPAEAAGGTGDSVSAPGATKRCSSVGTAWPSTP